jgi:hypothetical protein
MAGWIQKMVKKAFKKVFMGVGDTRNIAQYNQSEYLEKVQHFFFSGVF